MRFRRPTQPTGPQLHLVGGGRAAHVRFTGRTPNAPFDLTYSILRWLFVEVALWGRTCPLVDGAERLLWVEAVEKRVM